MAHIGDLVLGRSREARGGSIYLCSSMFSMASIYLVLGRPAGRRAEVVFVFSRCALRALDISLLSYRDA